MLRRSLALLPFVLLGGLAGGALWLLGSDGGLQAAARLAGAASLGRLHIEGAHGRLLGPLSIERLRWATPELSIDGTALRLDWSPAALLHGELRVAELAAAHLRLDLAASPEPAPPPSDLRLPLNLHLARLRLDRLELGDTELAHDIAGRLDYADERFELVDFAAASGAVRLAGHARLQAAAPMALTASAELTGQLDEKPLAVQLTADGPLAGFKLRAIARQGVEGEAEAELTPFAAAPFARARIALDQLDPAAWLAGAPTARLKLAADLVPQGDGVAGSFALVNRQPGPLDRQRLPLTSIDGRLAWQGERAELSGLRAALAGGGELSGDGRWQQQALHLELQARNLDAARLVASLRPTRLAGPLSATLGAERQALGFDLRDARFQLQGEARQAGGRLDIPRLALSADNARLELKGSLQLAGERSFSAEGELVRFDPARFARLPAAQINARLAASGRLAPRPVVDARFALQDSRLANQPLAGQGRLLIDWPQVPQADLELLAGPNRLQAKGAFGRPGDRLAIDLNAPQLAPYGVEGSLTGHLDLAGTPQQAQLAARLDSPRFGLPGRFRADGLKLAANLAGAPDAPLQLDLAVGRLSTPEQPALLKDLRLQGNGSQQAHRLTANARLLGQHSLALALAGGLSQAAEGWRWQGQLLEARVNEPQQPRSLRLDAPAALQLGAAGWSIGPAVLSGSPNQWQASLQAAADGRRLNARLSGRGPRIGRIEAELAAGMAGPWALDQQAPWTGSAQAEIADLGWLGEVLGERWQSAGRLNGRLQLAGTPARPRADGRLRGDELALRLPEQGLNLVRGELDLELKDNLLRVGKLGFDSLLQPLPRPLRLLDRDGLATLTERPGRLEVSGEMRLDRERGADNAFLDVRLDRLGAYQLPEQWVAVSGDGRLSWQGDTFGARGKLAVDAGYWQLAPSGAPRLSDDVVIKRPAQESPAAGLRPRLDLDLTTDLGRNFLFAGAGLSARLAGDIRLRASGRDLPRASGSIRTRDGRFDAYGQQLAIERGVLTFQGLLDNPALDVRAVRKGLAVEPGVQIGGSARRPVIKLVSDPELPDAEKLAWLVLGHGPEQMGAGDATVLLSAAGGLLGNDAGGVVQQLKRNFGIDEFGVRTGQIGDTGSRQPASRVAGGNVDTTSSTGAQILSVGKRLSANALLSYEQALGKAESIVKLTVSLSRQVSLIGRAGSDNALDLFYTLSFGRGSTADGEARQP